MGFKLFILKVKCDTEQFHEVNITHIGDVGRIDLNDLNFLRKVASTRFLCGDFLSEESRENSR